MLHLLYKIGLLCCICFTQKKCLEALVLLGFWLKMGKIIS
jgi:hypothetical protein